MNKIIMLCRNIFLENNSGINTFITHMENMCIKLGYQYEIITEFTNKEILHDNIFFINSFNNCSQILYERYRDENNLYICDSLETLETLNNLSLILNQGTFMYYTHIGDIIHDKTESFDFSVENKNKTLNILLNNNNILIGTQSRNLQNYLNITFSKRKVVYLPEPLYLELPLFNNVKVYDICCIMNNNKRKRIDKVINICSKMSLSLNLITSDLIGYENLLYSMGKCNMNIIEQVSNKNVPSCLSLSKILIHFSDIEVFPYSILESASILPVIINKNSLWGKLFPDEYVYKVDYDNFEECEKTINYLLNNPIPKMDLNKYIMDTENTWKQFLGGDNEL